MDKFISLGIIDKKLIWPFIYSLTKIIAETVSKYWMNDKQILIINYFGSATGQMLILLIPYISRYQKGNQARKKEKKCTKKNVKFFFLLLLFHGVFFGTIAASSFIWKSDTNPHSSSFCTKEAVEIILITLVTYIFLKYKYFNHHLISLIVFCLISIGIDFLLDNYEEAFINQAVGKTIMDVIVILLEIVNYCYQKYMMDTLYYNYWSIVFAMGAFLFSAVTLYTIYTFIKKDESTLKSFEDIGAGYIILGYVVNTIISFFQNVSRILTLDYHTPNHMLIAYEITKIFAVLTQSESDYRWYSLILFIFQFFILMFYLEIFELNFCNLNKNTKKNIQVRAVSEELIGDEKSDRTSVAEVGTGYLVKGRKTNNSQMEMGNLNVSINESDNGLISENIRESDI